MYLWRPVIAEPPLCTFRDLQTKLSIEDLANLHEVLDLKEAIHERARRDQEKNR